MAPTPREERLFNPDGRRHYRRSYSTIEVAWGLAVLVGLALVAAWVGWMGAHPDPSLFDNSASLLDPGTVEVDRGPLPAELAAEGYREGKLSSFGPDNLFEKINGRADYFKSRGFERLWFVTLVHLEQPALAVDLELYDMGAVENALGAFTGEKPPETQPQRESGGVHYRAGNAAYLARGRFYARAIGGAEEPDVLRQLTHLVQRLTETLEGQALPWGHRLLSEGLQVPDSDVGFHRENAFSFGFARGVFTALLSDETELFVLASQDEASAGALAERFVEGFASIGERTPAADGPWVVDRYLSTWASTRSRGPIVYGVRGAPDQARGREALQRLHQVVEGLSPAQVLEARGAAVADPGGTPQEKEQGLEPLSEDEEPRVRDSSDAPKTNRPAAQPPEAAPASPQDAYR